MFISTTINSKMLSFTSNSAGTTNKSFRLPFDFTEGRDIVLSILPFYANANGGSFVTADNVSQASGKNVFRVTIPPTVTSHSINIVVYARALINGYSALTTATYNLTVLFDINNNVITFTPTSTAYSGGTSVSVFDVHGNIPVLLNIYNAI